MKINRFCVLILPGLLRRFAPRNDVIASVVIERSRTCLSRRSQM